MGALRSGRNKPNATTTTTLLPRVLVADDFLSWKYDADLLQGHRVVTVYWYVTTRIRRGRVQQDGTNIPLTDFQITITSLWV